MFYCAVCRRRSSGSLDNVAKRVALVSQLASTNLLSRKAVIRVHTGDCLLCCCLAKNRRCCLVLASSPGLPSIFHQGREPIARYGVDASSNGNQGIAYVQFHRSIHRPGYRHNMFIVTFGRGMLTLKLPIINRGC